MKTLFHSSESFDSAKIQIGSEKKSKPLRSDKEINGFKTKFISFHWIVGAFSLWSIFYLCDYPGGEFNFYFSPTCSGEYPSQLYNEGFQFDFYALLSESETSFDRESQLIWTKRNLTYGGVQSIFSFSTNVSISEVRLTIIRQSPSNNCHYKRLMKGD